MSDEKVIILKQEKCGPNEVCSYNVSCSLAAKDRFIDGLICGLSKSQAALYAGLSAPTGNALYVDEYVRKKFQEVREAIEDENLCSRKELILNARSIAFDELQDPKTRIAASAYISKLLGHEAPTKSANLHIHQGGVMLVPVTGDMQDWAKAAQTTQEKLKSEVRQ